MLRAELIEIVSETAVSVLALNAFDALLIVISIVEIPMEPRSVGGNLT